jgi:hypothetical protein
MFTQCPYCETVYPLPPRLLAEGRGRILCGRCEREFDALERLRERDDFAENGVVADAEAGSNTLSSRPRLEPEEHPSQGDLFAAPVVASRTPRFSSTGRLGSSIAWGWLLSALLLSAALALQVGIAQRELLAADPFWRPPLARVCGWVGCTLSPWRQPQALQLLSRNIGPHPSVADALLVTATVRNPGPYPQAWPRLELSLSDLDGKKLALRRFSPEEYLGGQPNVESLAPGESVIARLELADPGKQAVAFAFEFR